tara:strand:+ start:56 stop:877 length:822 start_codon:yes stop_codon:yes gene_type:complete
MLKNLVFGSSGLVGNEFYKLNKDKQKYFFFSNKNSSFKKLNLDKKINLNINQNEFVNIFFFASPRFLEKNNKEKIIFSEYIWLKKVINHFNINKLIFLSSPSIYYKKSIIGKIKKKCEKLILSRKKKINYYQIWRPYNLVGTNNYLSDHFHNFAIKKIFIEKKKSFNFYGSEMDKRGYSSAAKFVKLLNNNSHKNCSFVINYGNKDLISTKKIIEIYSKINFKKYKRKFVARFQSKKANISVVNHRSNSIFNNEKSRILIKKHIVRVLNEKKM